MKSIIPFDIETVPCPNERQVKHLQGKIMDIAKAEFLNSEIALSNTVLHFQELDAEYRKKIQHAKDVGQAAVEKAVKDETKEKRYTEMQEKIERITSELNEKKEKIKKEVLDNYAFVKEQTDPSKNKKAIEVYEKTNVVAFRGAIFCIAAVELESNTTFAEYAAFDENFLQNEKKLLTNFFAWLKSWGPNYPVLAGHNILGFDIPFLDMRCVYHQIEPPPYLKPFSKWNHPNHFDTLERMTHWNAFGKDAPSVHELLCFFGFESHKTEMNGSMVWDYVKQGKYEEVIEYCKTDVKAEALLVKMFEEEIRKALVKAEKHWR